MKIVHPTLLLDKNRCIENIKKMAVKAEAYNLAFKPHFKTHQSPEIGRWFKDAGITGITVSSIKMAEYFADAGWQDITIAFPANIRAVAQLNDLAEKVFLTLLVDSAETSNALAEGMKSKVNILIELDAGSKRTGISVTDDREVKEVVEFLNTTDQLVWKGFYSHFGHTYGCRGEQEIQQIFASSLGKVNTLIRRLGLEQADLHIGDTPGCTVATDFPGVTAITPGNFVFYDVMQQQIGSCDYRDIAVVMACPVVSKNPERKEVIVHGGAVHFSKETLKTDTGNSFGILVSLTEDGIGEVQPENQLIALSQEHGVLKVKEDSVFDQIKVGDVLGFLPIHSCLTAECMGVYKDFSDDEMEHL